jgi:assimilatory nitrate reductase catalytic subunit
MSLATHGTSTQTAGSVCGYCSTGCRLTVHLQEGMAVGVTPDPAYPVNLGMACPKGWEALEVLDAPDRARQPLLRDERGKRRSVTWDTAMRVFVQRFKEIQAKYGNESIAFLSTGQIPTEEMALLGALAKFGMGMKHGDGNTRQCMATAVVAYKQAFGFDAPPYTYDDLEQSDCLVLIGSNLCIAHPVMWQRVMHNRHRPQIVVIDPRRTETAMQATRHLAPTLKSDLTLLYGLARVLIERGWIDRAYIDAHTRDFDAFAAHVQPFTLDRVADETNIRQQDIEALAATIHSSERVSFWWTMGVNQSHQGVRTAQAIINLALMTGNIGRPGTGANSITGQCNAMGSRLFSNTTSLLGGRDFANPQHRREVAEILGIDRSVIPQEAGWPYHRIMEGILRQEIRGLWVVCTNPAHSWINQSVAADILGRLDFLVVQDMYVTTETTSRADLVLPAAGWGEKEGTFINSERRIGTLKKVARAPGNALSDFSIFRLVADYWGCRDMFSAWTSPQAVFQILKRLSAGQPCDFSGIDDYRTLDLHGGIQWPYGHDPPPAERERRLFADGKFYHADGRARFLFEEPRPLPEPPSRNYPLQLLTGRGSAAQWHTQTRTSKSPVLKKLYPSVAYAEINPSDAQPLGIRHGDRIDVCSQRGRVSAKAFLTRSVQPGHVFLPMHFAATNQLTHAAFDPYSHQPAYKACSVRIEKTLRG